MPWFDKYCKRAKAEMRSSLRDCRRYGFHENRVDSFVGARREYKKVIADAKRCYWEDLKRDLQLPCDPQRFWKAVKRFSPTVHSDRQNMLSVSSVRAHFSRAFNCFSSVEYRFSLFKVFDSYLDMPFSGEELDAVLRACKTGKAAGEDLIPYEFYKGLNTQNQSTLIALFKRVRG